MTFTPLKPAQKSSAGIGIKASLSLHKDGSSVFRISLSEALQERYFGRSLIGAAIHVLLGRAADAGKLQLRIAGPDDAPGAIEVRKMMRGSVMIKCAGWRELGQTKQASTICPVVTYDIAAGTVELRLPEWANSIDRLAHEHALKPAVRAAG
ncbi:MAG: hypothetical protein WD046_13770 [Paracoccaceae bacterium]